MTDLSTGNLQRLQAVITDWTRDTREWPVTPLGAEEALAALAAELEAARKSLSAERLEYLNTESALEADLAAVRAERDEAVRLNRIGYYDDFCAATDRYRAAESALEAATETLRNLVKWSEGMGDDAFGDLFWEDARAFLARTAGGKAT